MKHPKPDSTPPYFYRVAACFAAVLLALGFAAPSASAQATTTQSGDTITLTYTGGMVDIPDADLFTASPVTLTLPVDDMVDVSNLEIRDVTARVNITHGYIGDLSVRLRHPDGTAVTLLNRPDEDEDDGSFTAYTGDGGCSRPHPDITWMDGAPDLMCPYDRPGVTGGNRRPHQPLSGFDNLALVTGSSRNWELEVSDNAQTHTGTVDIVVLTITVGYSVPAFSITGPSVPVNEGENATLTVALSEGLPQDVTATVDYATSDGTATAGEDYDAVTNGVLNFTAGGDLTQTITVPVLEDSIFEGATPQTFTVTLSNPSGGGAIIAGAPYGSPYAEVAITDGDTEPPVLSFEDTIFSAREGDPLVFTVRLSEAIQGNVTVDFSTAMTGTPGVTAEAGDFTAASGTLTITAGQTSATFTVATVEDSDNQDESIVVELSNLSNAVFFREDPTQQSTTGGGTITEAPTFFISNPGAVNEGGVAVFTVVLSESVAATVDYMTVDGTATAGEDYTAVSGTLTFTAGGTTTQTIAVPVLEDGIYEGGQTIASQDFNVRLSNPTGMSRGRNARLAFTSGEAVILDQESVPTLTVADTSAGEGSPLEFVARLDIPNESGVTVDYAITGGTATPTVDFTEIPGGTLTIPAGEIMATFTVATIENEDNNHGDTVFVELTNPMGAEFASSVTGGTLTVTGTITEISPVEEANKVVLPQVATVAAMQITGAVSGRIDTVFNRTAENDLSVRGKNWKQFLASEAEKARGNERAELPDLDLNLSDFAFSIAADGDEWGGGDYGESSGGALDNLGIWGRGYYAGVDVKEAGDASNVNFDGSIVGGIIGADVLLNDKVVTGLGVNFSKAGVDFTVDGDTGTHDTTVWSFHPYIGLKAGPSVTLYATMGYGIGSLEASETGGGTPRENDVSLLTGGAGGKGTVYGTKAGAWDVKVNVLGDFVYAQLSEDGGIDASGGIFRGGFEVAGDSGGGAGASLKLAYRADFGDTVGGSGLEVGGGVNFGSPEAGITVNLDGRILAYHSEELSEYGFSGDVSWSRGKTGPYAKFSPTWGAVNDRRDDLWENGANGWSEADSSGRRYNFEAGYGVGLPEEAGIMKLFARSEMEDGETVFRSGGVDVEVGSGLTAGYETVDRSGATVEHRGYLRFGGAF